MNTITFHFPVGTPYSAKIKWIATIKSIDQTVGVQLTVSQQFAVVTVEFEITEEQKTELREIWYSLLADIRAYHRI